MEDNYWSDDTPIKATIEEKKKIFEKYELWMFRETCKQLDLHQETTFGRNLLFESLAVHTRLLLEFFYCEKNIKYQNDLLAEDFVSDIKKWREIRQPLLTQVLKDAKNKADKQLAHLSLWRLRLERNGNKDWEWHKISNDMEKIIEKFESLN